LQVRIGRFPILDVVGESGIRAVHEALDPGPDRTFSGFSIFESSLQPLMRQSAGKLFMYGRGHHCRIDTVLALMTGEIANKSFETLTIVGLDGHDGVR
jgi:hypothetical protein